MERDARRRRIRPGCLGVLRSPAHGRVTPGADDPPLPAEGPPDGEIGVGYGFVAEIAEMNVHGKSGDETPVEGRPSIPLTLPGSAPKVTVSATQTFP